MQHREYRRAHAVAARALALFLVLCLAECATEQRINRIGSKSSGLIEKVNGWRSQRGGSCLSYGHSCWGAHGKRSGKPPAAAPDWYVSRMLRRMAANAELNRAREAPNNDEFAALYQMDVPDDAPTNKLMHMNADAELASAKNSEAIPMLDEELLSKMKIWKIMRDAAEEKMNRK